ncbi:MAG: amidohydrolase, partial [Planctomycetes bacterium]|nr:amidohydrolase [Planctomycetota bacterium]
MSSWQSELDQAIQQRSDRIVGIRRHLHAHPEVSGEERETSLYLYQQLGDEGFDVRLGPDGRGVMADLPGCNGQHRIALRA